jgi:hypothetical protein
VAAVGERDGLLHHDRGGGRQANRAELSTIKPRGLRARAAEMGIEEETIEAAMDEDDVKEALIAMIMQGQGR